MTKRVLSVGQCGRSISRVVEDQFDAVVVPASSRDEAVTAIEGGDVDLVLVNRILDADGTSGMDVVRDIRGINKHVPMMLVSNYQDAQDSAVALGANRGFGKSSLHASATIESLAEFLPHNNH